MSEFSMTCSCGHEMKVDAPDRATAVSKLQEMMDKDGIAAHMREYHQPGEPLPSVAQVHQMIAQNTAAL